MRLSRTGYYADFVVYPVLLAPLAAVLVLRDTWQQHAAWFVACLAGLAVATLLEYAVHRWVLHRVPPFLGMHDLHHADPRALVGTPTWLSAALIGGVVLAPLWWQAGMTVSAGATFGLILGYLWYVTLHHGVHRWRAREGSYLHRAKVRHALHHGAKKTGDFGVTTALWDRLFGTSSSAYSRPPRL